MKDEGICMESGEKGIKITPKVRPRGTKEWMTYEEYYQYKRTEKLKRLLKK